MVVHPPVESHSLTRYARELMLIIRVVATSKDTYSLRYFKVDQDEAEDEE